MTNTKKLSQIDISSSPPNLSDQLVGVGGGNADKLYSVQQVATSINSTIPINGNIFSTKVAAASATIPSSVTFLQTQGYNTAGDEGGAIYTKVGGNPNIGAGGFQSADGAWWKISINYSVNVRCFGAKGDDVTDDLQAFKDALATLKDRTSALFGRSGDNVNFPGNAPRLLIPPGTYYLSNTLHVHQPVHIMGVGSGAIDNPGNILRTAVNKTSIVLHEYRTLDNGGGNSVTASGLGDGSNSTVEGLSIYGGGAISVTGPFFNVSATDQTAHGIWIRGAGCKVLNCWIGFTSGSGVFLNATSGSTGANAGQASLFYLQDVWTNYCQGDGFHVEGSDSNAGTVFACSAISVGQAGFRDYSFLGNTWIGCHARDCGNGNPNDPTHSAANTPVASCTYLGTTYFIAAGQEITASTTTPGTNSAVWVPNPGMGSVKTWVTGIPWATGGSYVMNPNNMGNSRALFLGCYQELGQAPFQGTAPGLVIGGNLDVGGPNNTGILGSVGRITGNQPRGIQTRRVKLLADGDDALSDLAVTPNPQSLVMGNSGSMFDWSYPQFANTSAPGNLQLAINTDYFGANKGALILESGHGASSTAAFTLAEDTGTNNMGPRASVFKRLWIGPGDHRIGFCANNLAIGDSTFHAIEDGQKADSGARFFYSTFTPGQPSAMVCSTSGTVGTTAAFKEMGRFPGTTTFGALPSSPSIGDEYCISDSNSTTWGANVTASSPGNYARINWNGTNWTVVGK